MPQTRTFSSSPDELMASQSIDLTQALDAKYLRTVVSAGRTSAVRPWKWHDEIGEINYGVGRGAKIAGYAKFGCFQKDKKGYPGKQVTNGLQGEIMARLGSPYGGLRALIERYFTLMKVPGEGYLIRTRENADGTGEATGYDFISAREIDTASTDGSELWVPTGNRVLAANQDIRRITLPGGSGATNGEALHHIVKAKDFLGRVWRPAKQYVDLPSSPMTALDTECELLHLLTINLKAKLTSRMALNGIFYVPNQINDIRSSAPTGKENEFHDNKVLDRLIMAATWAVLNHEKPEAAVPIFMTGPGEQADNIKHIVMDQELYRTDMELRVELIDRLLTGLDVQKQKAKGDDTTNHWGAWANNDDELRVNVRPDLEMLAWSLTRMILYREMREANVADATIAKYTMWFDLSAAVSNTNLAEDARQASDRILINPEAARRSMGFEESDKLEGDELVRAIGIKMDVPELALWGTPEFDAIEAKVGWENIGSKKTGPSADSPAEPTKVGPGKGNPGSPNDQKGDGPKRLKPAS